MRSQNTCGHVGIWSQRVTFKTDQVSFSTYTLSVLYGGLIGSRDAIFFVGLDNKLWLYNDVNNF